MEFIKIHLQRGEMRKLCSESGISYAYGYQCLNENHKAFHLEFLMKCQAKAVERANILVAMKEQTQSLKTVLQ